MVKRTNNLRKVSIARLKQEMQDTVFLSDDLAITTIDYLRNPTSEIPVSLDGFAAMIMMSGTAVLSIDTDTYEIRPNMLVFFRPGSVIRTIRCSSDATAYLTACSKSFVNDIQVDISASLPIHMRFGRKPCLQVTEQDVTDNLNRVLDANARLESAAEGAVIDDKCYAVIHYSGKRNGTDDYKLSADSELVDMSAPQTMPGLAEGIKGLKKGDVKDIETKEGNDTISYHVTVDDIKNKIVPALDDSFAKDMGFDTLDALKAKVKESLDEEAKQNARRDEVAQIENHLVKMNQFDLPQSLVEEYTESSLNNFVRSMTQLKPEQLTADQKKAFEERIRPSVEKDLRIGYIVHAIAKKENLEATEADWKAELDKSIAANSQNKEDEKKIKAFFEERKAHILATLSERKVFDFLKEQAKYK